MATFTTSTHKPVRPFATNAADAVVNVRRPHLVTAEIVPEPARAALGLDDAPLPPTVLRLPDLAAIAKRLPAMRGKLKVAAIAQWGALGLGGLLAMWLIFGGRPPKQEATETAPTWTAPPRTVEAAAPGWNGPGSSGAAHAQPAPPTHETQLPVAAQHLPAAEPQPPGPAPGPEFDPYQQLQEGGAAPEPSNGDEAARPGAPGGATFPGAEVRTAMRPGPAANTSADRFQPSEAEPLNVTVPVPQ